MEIETNQEKLRERISALFRKKSDVAKEIGIPFDSFSSWLNGKDVGLKTLQKINYWLKHDKPLIEEGKH